MLPGRSARAKLGAGSVIVGEMVKAKPSQASEVFLQAGREHLGAYAALVHGTDKPEIDGGVAVPKAHHKQIITALTDDSLADTVILAPRGAAKTTLVQCYLEWTIGRALHVYGEHWADVLRIIYISHDFSAAAKMSNAVKATIKSNQVYHLLFPHVKPDLDKWSEPQFRLLGGKELHPNFICFGIASPELGARGLYILLDDICDPQNMKTETERENVIYNLKTAVLPMRIPGGRVIMPCTRWHEGDAAGWASDEMGWHTIHIQALSPDGESYWPERFPTQTFQKMRAQDPKTFALQYQNEVTPSEGQRFRREWFEPRFDYVPDRSQLWGVMSSWDTAGSFAGRSYTVGFVAAITLDWKILLLHMHRGKHEYADHPLQGVPGVKTVIRDTIKRFHVDETLIEAKSSGAFAVQELELESGIGRIVGLQPPGQRGGPVRDGWIENVCEVASKGRIVLPSTEYIRKVGGDDWRVPCLRELLGWPELRNDDVPMALAYLVNWVDTHRVKFEIAQRQQSQPITYGRSTEQAVRV